MTFLGDLFDSKKGAGFQATSAGGQAPGAIQQSVTADQVNGAYNTAQAGIGQQQNFVNALAAQNGIGNQSNVFGQQQELANQLGQQAKGEGPNVALDQLNQTTGANVANQAALMASQRGTGANPGMMARQAAQQGAQIQQQAVGQGATMRAQQQLAAQQALQQQQGMMGNLATTQVGQQANSLTGLNQMAQNEQNTLLGAQANQNQQNIGMQSNLNQANAGIAGINAKGQADVIGGLMSGVGQAAMMAKGGMVNHYASGGGVAHQDFVANSGPQSAAGKALKQSWQPTAGSSAMSGGAQGLGAAAGKGIGAAVSGIGAGIGAGINQLGSLFGSDAEAYQAPSDQDMMGTAPNTPYTRPTDQDMMGSVKMAKGGGVKNLKAGGNVAGKAKKAGDSLENDTVPAMLSPKEIVLPRSVTMSQDPVGNAAKFVAAILAKENMGKKK